MIELVMGLGFLQTLILTILIIFNEFEGDCARYCHPDPSNVRAVLPSNSLARLVLRELPLARWGFLSF